MTVGEGDTLDGGGMDGTGRIGAMDTGGGMTGTWGGRGEWGEGTG